MTVTALLVNSTIKMSLVILVALAAMALMRNRSAALRHWVLAVAVACAPVYEGAILPTACRSHLGDRVFGHRAIPCRGASLRLPGCDSKPTNKDQQ